jgi:hypothetical protein
MFSTLSDSGESVRLARLRAAAPRYLAIAVLAVLLLLGLKSLIFPPRSSVPSLPATADLPSRSFALQFARAYLTYDADRPNARLRALASFVPEDLDRNAGSFPESGAQRVLWAEVASDQPAIAGGRIITVATGLSTQPSPAYLSIPVRHPRDGRLSLGGYPSFVGPPLVNTAANASSFEEVANPELAEVVTRVLRNYLAGSPENLRADLSDDAVVLATLRAHDTKGVSYTLTYEVGLVHGDRPYVNFIEVIPTGS